MHQVRRTTPGDGRRWAIAAKRLAYMLAGGAALLTCTASPAALRPVQHSAVLTSCDGTCRERMNITFLGVSGFLIEWQGRALLSGPLFSRFSLQDVLDNVRAPVDKKFIARVLSRPPLRDAMARVDGIIIGHSHYDHLMDVPWVAEHYATRATIYGPPTMGHLLAGDTLLRPRRHATMTNGDGESRRDRVVVIGGDSVGDAEREGTWIAVHAEDETTAAAPHFRVMALRSEHAPNFSLGHIFRFTFAPGTAAEDRATLPRRIQEWKLGESYAYLIDLLRPNGEVAFRIYYMDAVARPPLGFPPRSLVAAGPGVTVALLCAGNFEQVHQYPDSLIRQIAPKQVLLGHWEDFFQPQGGKQHIVPTMRVGELTARMDAAMVDGTNWIAPATHWSDSVAATFHYCTCR
jgi:ribonuclease BN (tRNA processing enzyme)